MDELISIDHGSGGQKTAQLIEQLFLPHFSDPVLGQLGDGAVLEGFEKIAFSTDSFVVEPLFFPGGDIGKLAVCGTVNDLAMCGAEPMYLSCGFIIEEGFPVKDLEKIVSSMAQQAKSAGVRIVTGDTKVVQKGRGDGIYINTAGVGKLLWPGLGRERLEPGDEILISGSMGDHGAAVMLARNDLLQGELESDCQALNGLSKALLELGGVKLLRDPTRGGLATTLNEFVEGSELGIELMERDIPVKPQVQAACDMLGLDPLYCANEGKLIAVVSADKAEAALELARSMPEGRDAAIIGKVSRQWPGKLVMQTAFGGRRLLQKLSGAQLPRIC